jgi:SOUL heme-binding protein
MATLTTILMVCSGLAFTTPPADSGSGCSASSKACSTEGLAHCDGQKSGASLTQAAHVNADGSQRLSMRDDWQNWRIGGSLGSDLFATTRKVSEELYKGQAGGRTYTIDTALPVGYPLPTPPGAMELKRYPSVRRAEQGGKGDMTGGMNGAFWPLFAHIQRNKIAMTAPVDMDLHWMRDRVKGAGAEGGEQGEAAEAAGKVDGSSTIQNKDRWTMSFLYRTADLRETGTEGTVNIVDIEPMTVVSIGLDGRGMSAGRAGVREQSVEAAIEKLNAWLDTQTEWVPYGSPRLCGYNDPGVRPANQWWEVQIPIKPHSNTQ